MTQAPTTVIKPVPNSTMHILTPITLGIDPGYSNVGMALREGNRCKWAATFRHTHKNPFRPNIDDVQTMAKFWLRVCDEATKVWRDIVGTDTRLRVVAETMHAPKEYIRGKPNKIGMNQWVPVYGMVAALVGRFPNIILIDPQGLSDAHLAKNGGTKNAADYVPPELIGKQAEGFGPNETADGERRDQQSAFAVAGVGVESLSTIDLNWRDHL